MVVIGFGICLTGEELVLVDEGFRIVFLLCGKIFVVSVSMMPGSPDNKGAGKRVILLDIAIINMLDATVFCDLTDFIDVGLYSVAIKRRGHIKKPGVGRFGPMGHVIVVYRWIRGLERYMPVNL